MREEGTISGPGYRWWTFMFEFEENEILVKIGPVSVLWYAGSGDSWTFTSRVFGRFAFGIYVLNRFIVIDTWLSDLKRRKETH